MKIKIKRVVEEEAYVRRLKEGEIVRSGDVYGTGKTLLPVLPIAVGKSTGRHDEYYRLVKAIRKSKRVWCRKLEPDEVIEPGDFYEDGSPQGEGAPFIGKAAGECRFNLYRELED